MGGTFLLSKCLSQQSSVNRFPLVTPAQGQHTLLMEIGRNRVFLLFVLFLVFFPPNFSFLERQNDPRKFSALMHWIFTPWDLYSNAGVTLGWKWALTCLLWYWILHLCLKSCKFCLDWLLAGLQKETYSSSGVCSDGCCASSAGASGQEKGEMSESICFRKRHFLREAGLHWILNNTFSFPFLICI